MIIQVNKDRTIIPVGTWGSMNENNYEVLKFRFPKELEDLNKRIVFYLGNKRVWDPILDNQYVLTNAVTKYNHVKCYIWLTKSDTEEENPTDFRTKLFEIHFFENDNADRIVPTPEEIDGFNSLITRLSKELEKATSIENLINTNESERKDYYENFKKDVLDGKYNGSSGVAVQPDEPTKEDIIMWYDTDDETDTDNYIDLEDIAQITNAIRDLKFISNTEIDNIANLIL